MAAGRKRIRTSSGTSGAGRCTRSGVRFCCSALAYSAAERLPPAARFLAGPRNGCKPRWRRLREPLNGQTEPLASCLRIPSVHWDCVECAPISGMKCKAFACTDLIASIEVVWLVV